MTNQIQTQQHEIEEQKIRHRKRYLENCFERYDGCLERQIEGETEKAYVAAIERFSYGNKTMPLLEIKDMNTTLVRFRNLKAWEYDSDRYGIKRMNEEKETVCLEVFSQENSYLVEELIEKLTGKRKIDRTEAGDINWDRISKGEVEGFLRGCALGNLVGKSTKYFDIHQFEKSVFVPAIMEYMSKPEGYLVKVWDRQGEEIKIKTYLGNKDGDTIKKVLRRL